MKTTFRLALVMFKGNGLANFAGGSSGRKKKLSATANIILFIFLVGYMLVIMTASSFGLHAVLAPLGLQGLLVSLYLSAGVILVFFFGLLFVISIFYHSSDVEKILPLPLKAAQIIGAKLLVTAFYEYLYLIVMVLPPLIIYGVFGGQGPVYYLFAALVVLALPVIPLCLAAVLVMLIMRFTPFVRNKDRFSMVSSILAMVLALGVAFGVQSLTSFSAPDLAQIVSTGASGIAEVTATVFPGTAWAAAALAGEQDGAALLKLVWFLLLSAAALLTTLFLGQLLYFKGVVGLSSAASNRRRLTSRELEEIGRSGSAFWTYVLKDVRILLRTPIFFLNNVLMNFIWPIFLLMPLLTNDEAIDIGALAFVLRRELASPGSALAPLALAVAFGVACFVTGTNGVAESALSREGKIFYIMKILPMSYSRQIWAKLTVGIILSLIGSSLLVILLAVIVQPPLWFMLLLILMLPGAILIPNLSGIIFEIFWPKLNWDNEQKAVKQNLNVVYGILLSLLLAALVIVPIFMFRLTLLPATLLVIAAPLLAAALLAALVQRIAPRRIHALDV